MSRHTSLPNFSRDSIAVIVHGMPFPLDHHAGGRNARIARIQRLLMGFPMEEASIPVDDLMKACKKETYKPSKIPQGPSRPSQQHVECPICLEAFVTNDAILRLPCNHPFHANCLLPWIRSNHDKCPFCRAEIITKQSQSSMAKNAGTAGVYPNSSNGRELPISSHARTSRNALDDIREIPILSHARTSRNALDDIREIPILSHASPSRIVSDQRQPRRITSVSSQGPLLPEPFNPFHPFPIPMMSSPYEPRSASIINITFSS